MEDIIAKKDCCCDNITPLLHDLLQSAQIIKAYAWGCSERLKSGDLDNDQLTDTFQIIYKHIQDIGRKIHAFAELK